MLRRIEFPAVLFGLFITALATNAIGNDVADCQSKDPDQRLKGCARIIDAGSLFGKRISRENLSLIHYNRGTAYSDKGQYDRAIADYTRAIRLNPKDADPYYNRGLAYQKKDLYDHAIADQNRAIKLNPKYANAFRSPGLTLSMDGQYARAFAKPKKVMKFKPNSDGAHRDAPWFIGLKPLGTGEWPGSQDRDPTPVRPAPYPPWLR